MPPLTEAARPLMWNINSGWVMYVLFAAALCVFGWGVYCRIRVWRRGRPDAERFGNWPARIRVVLREFFLQTQVRNSRFPAIFHSFLFYSFAALLITTILIMIQYDAGHVGVDVPVFHGYVYVVFSVASELAGLLILIGVAMAAFRRYVRKPQTVLNTRADGWVLLLVAGMVLTGYAAEGLRIAGTDDPWRSLTPIGNGLAALLGGAEKGAVETAHASMWWFHTVLALSWIALIPYTKFAHLLLIPTNVFFSKLKPRGELQRVDIEKAMESAESEADLKIGVQQPAELTWKQRLDADTCVSCGRCEEVCPAYLADRQSFSPREFIARLETSIHTHNGNGHGVNLVGSAFDEEFIWQCRTCTVCMEVCPGMIEHVDTLMEIRRNEVLMQGRMPADAGRALRMLEANGNPFGQQSERVDWIGQMNVRVLGPGDKADVLYWIGCCATFDPQKRRIAEDLCRLMEKCGLDFGVLGAGEKCCGDPARVIGHEMLFQQIAREQIEILKQREFKFLMTSCPHCYNVLAHEYRQFGGNFNVVHHSEFLHEMVWRGKLVPRSGIGAKYVYHDPCYLGRYQKIYDSPREVIKSIPGAQLVEMKSYRSKSLCCGGGGGHYWMDLRKGERINNLRTKQAREAGADTIVTGCAYCLHMLQDSVKLLDYEDSMRVVDVASLVLESVEKTQ